MSRALGMEAAGSVQGTERCCCMSLCPDSTQNCAHTPGCGNCPSSGAAARCDSQFSQINRNGVIHHSNL